MRDGHDTDNYKNCGRHATITPEFRKWLVSRLKALRRTTVCTSQTLQRELAKVKGVAVSAWTVRRHLGIAGFSWLPRSRKRKRVVANKGGASGK